jgi:hypothetical protein
MKKSFFLWMISGILLSGCHTIRPISMPQETLISAVPSIQQNVGLIIDDDYRNFVSKDRGNPLADPQRYMVGEALTPLTEAYFKRSASKINTFSDLEEIRSSSEKDGADVYVYLKVLQFDNTVRLTEQRIDVQLAADLYDRRLNLIKTVQSQGMAQGGVWGNDVNTTVSTAMQLALTNLIREIQTQSAAQA